MREKTIFKTMVVIAGLLLQFNLSGQTPPITLHVEKAGTLSTLIADNRKYEITDLTLTGNLNGTDIRYIREMTGRDARGNTTNGKLANLNLSGTNIVSGGDYYFYYAYFTPSTCYTKNNFISTRMFYECSQLKSIIFPNSVTSIELCAFSDCYNLTSVTIGNNLASIGDAYVIDGVTHYLNVGSIFSRCPNIKEFIVTEQNQNYSAIDGVLFNKDKTTIIKLPQTKSGTYTIPESVTSIHGIAFDECSSLTGVIIPNSVTSGVNFLGCNSLASIIIPNSVIEYISFTDCNSLKDVTIGNSVTSVYFSSCSSLTSVTIPNSVTSYVGFSDCSSLTSVIIGNSANSVRFYDCNKLTEIYSKNPTPPSGSFDSETKKTCKLYIPKGSYAAYWVAWGFDNIIEMDFEDVTAINPIHKDNTTIKSIANGIAIETKETTPVSVYNLSGQIVYQSVINENKEIPLNKGVYIVSLNNESEKVIVK